MFEYKKPEEAGVRSDGIAAFIRDCEEKHLHLHSFRVLRHDAILAEAFYKPYRPEETHMLFSLSKSFTSTAVGFAVQDGLLSLADPLTKFFPEYLTNEPCANMRKMTVKHLITMNTGHEEEPFRFDPAGTDLTRTFLQSYIPYEPGTHFLYNTDATYILSRIVQKVTGKTVFDYLKDKLFRPLGMHEDIWWETMGEGANAGGFGFNAHLDELMKLGTLYLHDGNWEGKQLLPAQWVKDAQTPWSDNSRNESTSPEWQSGYGYQFWMCSPEHVYRGDGAFGQYMVIMPDQDMLFVANSGLDDMGAVMALFWKDVLATAGAEDPRSDCGIAAAQQDLASLLSSRVLQTPFEEAGIPAQEMRLPNGALANIYRMSDNLYNLQEIAFAVDSSYVVFNIGGVLNKIPLTDGGTWQDITLDVSKTPAADRNWWSSARTFYEKASVKSFASGGKLYVNLAYRNTPYEDEFVIRFLRHGIDVTVNRNVGFLNEPVRMLGVSER